MIPLRENDFVTNFLTGLFGAGVLTGTLLFGGAFTATTSVSAPTVTSTQGVFTYATATTAFQVGASGTPIKGHLFTTAAVDPSSLGTGGSTSTYVALPGAAVGDEIDIGLQGDWTGTSSSERVFGSVTSTGGVLVVWQNTSSTAVNLSNSTYGIADWQH